MTSATKAAGVRINLLSKNLLDKMATTEKIRFILDEVESGKVLVLERGLTPQEEAKLIEATMSEIVQDHFTGIEMQSYGNDKLGRWQKLIKNSGLTRPRMVVIGPANLLKTVSRDSQSVEAVILAEQGLLMAGA